MHCGFNLLYNDMQNVVLIVILLGFTTVVVHSSEYEPKPLPATAQTMRRKYEGETLEFHRDTLGRDFMRQGSRDPRWDAQAVEFLEKCALAWSKADSISTARLIADGQAVLALGCDDPMVQCGLAYALQDVERYAEAVPLYEEAGKSFAKHPYTAFRRAQCSMQVMECYEALYGPVVESWSKEVYEKSNGHYQAALAEGLASLDDACFKNRERILYDEVNRYFSTHAKCRAEMVRRLATHSDRPGFSPWLQNLFIGTNEIDIAWRKRGSGWSNDVTEEGWKGFKEHLAIARQRLTKAYDMHPNLPYAAAEMVAVSMADGGDPERMWFDRAIAADIECQWAYSSYAVSLSSRWGGSKEQMLDFADECLATKRFDTWVPFQYFITWRIMVQNEENWDLAMFRGSPRIYKSMLELWNGYIEYARKHDPAKVDWYESKRIALAYSYGDMDSAKTWRRQFAGHFFTESLESYFFYYDKNTTAMDDIEELAQQADSESP